MSFFSELKQIQNEKRRLLVETETEKLKSLDESFKRKFDNWRDKLEPRKQVRKVLLYRISYQLMMRLGCACFTNYIFVTQAIVLSAL